MLLPYAPISRSHRTGTSRALLSGALSPGFQIVPRHLSNTSPTMYPHLPYEPAEHLKQSGWPEEDLTSTADEGGGYYRELANFSKRGGMSSPESSVGADIRVCGWRETTSTLRGKCRFPIDKQLIPINQRGSPCCNQGPNSLCIEGN